MNYINYINFKREAAKFKKMIKQAKEDSWTKFHESISPNTNMTTVWKKIKGLTVNSKKKVQNNNEIHGKKQTALEFLNNNFPSNQLEPDQFQVNKTNNELELKFTIEDFNLVLKDKKNTSAGIDKIDYNMIKNFKDINKISLIDLINKSIKSKNFPNSLGLVKIIPIQKKSSKQFDINNYRPIALIPNITKVINSMIKDVLENQVSGLLPKYSFGFRKGTNTIHCVNSLIQQINLNREERLNSIVIFLDISKAFNSVSHISLFEILKSLDIPNDIYQWLILFLNLG